MFNWLISDFVILWTLIYTANLAAYFTMNRITFYLTQRSLRAVKIGLSAKKPEEKEAPSKRKG